jgi:hypothetical protein
MTEIAASEKVEITEILACWDKLTSNEKELVIPVLLDRTRAWHSWSMYDDTIVDWLRDKFADVGISFRNV